MSGPDGRAGLSQRLGRMLANRDLARAETAYGLVVVAQAAWVSIMVVILFDRAGPVGPGLFLATRQFAGAATAPFFAVLGQRRAMQKVLAVSALVRAAAVATAAAALALADPPVALLFVLALGEGLMASAPNAVHDAMLPRVARRADELVSANALTSVLDLAGYVAGGAVAALLAFTLGTESVLLAVVALLAASAAVVASVRTADERREPATRRALLQSLLGGARHLRRNGDAGAVVATLGLASAISGFAVATASEIAVVILDLDADAAPLLIAVGGLGGLAGGLAMLRLIGSHPLALLVAGGIVLTALAAFAILTASVVVVALAFFAFGAGTAAQAVGCRTLLHRVVPPGELGGAVGVNGLLSVASVGLGGLAASLLIVAVGLRPLLVGAGVAVIALALVVFRRLGRVERAADRYDRELALLEAVAVFDPMSLTVKTQLAMALERHEVRVGEEVVREGEPARTLYVIERGRFGAYVDGRRVRTMSAGDHFGEIALLSGSTRTATVRADGDATIWSLPAADFLAALRGNTQAHAIAAAVVERRHGSAAGGR